jgi:nitrate/nitrite transport system ATP-binding protein
MSAFLELRGVGKSFPDRRGVRHVLDNVSLSVERGKFVAVLGAMGSGKSTLLAIAAGLTPADAGAVLVGGTPVSGISPTAAYVFQNYSLLPWLSALENVRLAVGAAYPDWPAARQREHAARTLERVGLGHALARRPPQLSGGMRQRVAIARAFATGPELLFLDEPFGALDALTRETLQDELARLCSQAERPVTTILITNSVDEAVLLADRIVPMTRGPRATLLAPIAVGLPRPRTAALLARDPRASHVRAAIVGALTGGAVVEPARAADARWPDHTPAAAAGHPADAGAGR